MIVRAYAPASVGNLIAGFDVLGAALAPVDGARLGDEVEAAVADPGEPALRLWVTGSHAGELPPDPAQNLVAVACDGLDRWLGRQGRRLPSLLLRLAKNLPVCSGLGSSSSSIVAALVAVNGLLDPPVPERELLGLAAAAEGATSGAAHYDNVAPCLLGGIQLGPPPATLGDPDVPRDVVRLPAFPAWRFVVVRPHLQVATARARQVLPREVPLAVATAQWGRLAMLVHAFHAGEEDLALRSLVDGVAEPARRGLIPGFEAARAAALGAGAAVLGISGSGPSVVAVVRQEAAGEAVRDAVREVFDRHGLGSDGWVCRLDEAGARILPGGPDETPQPA